MLRCDLHKDLFRQEDVYSRLKAEYCVLLCYCMLQRGFERCAAALWLAFRNDSEWFWVVKALEWPDDGAVWAGIFARLAK